jgi:hypothetical protein
MDKIQSDFSHLFAQYDIGQTANRKINHFKAGGHLMNIIGLIRSTLPFSALLLTACLSGGGGGGSSTTTPATTGANSVVYAVIKTAPIATCANGGITVQSGIDTNGNGVLDPSEVTSTQYVCNGAAGTNGTNGAAGAGITWVNAASSVQAASNTGYLASNAAPVTISLPAAPNVGDVIQVNGIGAGGWTIAQNFGQKIITQDIVNIAGASTTGTISGAQYDAIELQYIAPNTFSVLSYAGNLNFVVTSGGGWVEQGGLTWMPVTATTYTPPNAAIFCSGTFNGQGGWRMPTLTELSALYTAYPDTSGVGAGDSTLLYLGWTLGYTWSSTPDSASGHYYVNLNRGNVGPFSDAFNGYVTCVR